MQKDKCDSFFEDNRRMTIDGVPTNIKESVVKNPKRNYLKRKEFDLKDLNDLYGQR